MVGDPCQKMLLQLGVDANISTRTTTPIWWSADKWGRFGQSRRKTNMPIGVTFEFCTTEKVDKKARRKNSVATVEQFRTGW